MSTDTEIYNTKKNEEKTQHYPVDDVESIASTQKSLIEPPDGGRSWLVLAGCWCVSVMNSSFVLDFPPSQLMTLYISFRAFFQRKHMTGCYAQ